MLSLYLTLGALSGMFVSVMVVANTLLGEATTMGVSLLVNHIIGLAFISALLLFGRNKKAIRGPGKPAPWYLYFNGLFGLAILNINFVTILSVGASLAMAAAVFGQALISVIYDLTGALGMQKRSLNRTKVLGLLIGAIGIVVMGNAAEGGSFALFPILLSAFAGMLTMTQMILNSTFATYKGSVRSAQQNFLSGLVAALFFYLLFYRRETVEGFIALSGLPILLIVSGGVLAIVVVILSNYVVVKIPAVYSALLMSAAQILTSLLIDTLFFDRFSLSLLFGALLLLVGMALNLYGDTKSE